MSEYQEKEFPEVIARLRAFVNEFSYREFCIKVNDSPDDADSSKIYFVLINPKTGLSINLCAHRLGNFYSGCLANREIAIFCGIDTNNVDRESMDLSSYSYGGLDVCHLSNIRLVAKGI